MINIDFSEKKQEIESSLPTIKKKMSDKLIAEPFYYNFKYTFCWSSNAIEGNTLSLEETINLLEYDEVAAGHTYTEYTEAKRLYSAINKFLLFDGQDITEDLIKDIDHEVTGIKKGYRTNDVCIGTLSEAVYYPPSSDKLDDLMHEFACRQKVPKGDVDGIISHVAQEHINFERIHPFPDGNGRTGRIVLNQNLINSGLLPITIDPTSKYKSAFKQYNKNKDISLMKDIIYKEEIRSIDNILEIAKEKEKALGAGKKRRVKDMDMEI